MVKRAKFAVLLILLLASTNFHIGGQPGPLELTDLVDKIVAQLDEAIRDVIFGALSQTLEEIKVGARGVLDLCFDGKDGLLGHVQQLKDQIRDTPQAWELRPAAENIWHFVNFAIEHLRKTVRTPKVEGARDEMRRAQAFFTAARGSREDRLAEGGARTLQALFKKER